MKPATANIAKTARMAVLVGVAILVACGSADAGTLDKVRDSNTLRIAYRKDAAPFSFQDAKDEPAGFMVNLCRAVVTKLADQLGVAEIKITYVPVTAANRFEAISNGTADLLCEPTSATLSRREKVDFSIATFIDGAGLMIRDDGPRDLAALAGKKVGVLAGTTTEESLRTNLKSTAVTAEIVPVMTHSEGIKLLDDGKIAAYFADRSILMFLAAQSDAPKRLRLADLNLTVEPYALALPRGDSNFRLAVDRALSHIYRSGEIITIFDRSFDAKIEPTGLLKILYLVSGLPD